MEKHTSYDDLILDLRALATYITRGGPGVVEWEEPEPRGRKGPDRKAHRYVRILIQQPARYDAIRWRLMTDPRFTKRPSSPRAGQQ